MKQKTFWQFRAQAPIATVAIVLLGLLSFGCRPSSEAEGLRAATLAQLAFNRKVTLKLLDDLEKTGKAKQALLFRARPKAAPLGWHLMHLAATEDRMAQSFGGHTKAVSREWAEEFKSGKPAGPNVPAPAEVRRYLKETRSSLEGALARFDLKRLDTKPTPESRFDFRTSLHVLMYHEPHHQGQAHATFNMYRGGTK